MKFVELATHLRALRQNRPPEAAMSVMEVWSAAIACPLNGVSQVVLNEARLPSPLLGFFSRLQSQGKGDIAAIYVHKPHPKQHKRRMEKHWIEFVIIKELMHCWSPVATYVGTPKGAADLLTSLNTPSGPFGAPAKSDYMAILAAAEVIMPWSQIADAQRRGKDLIQLGHEHGLHPHIMGYISQHDMMENRKTGSL